VPHDFTQIFFKILRFVKGTGWGEFRLLEQKIYFGPVLKGELTEWHLCKAIRFRAASFDVPF